MENISTKYLMYIIDKILIPKFPINCNNLKADNDIFGTNIKALKCKTVSKLGDHFQLKIERIPDGILDRYKNVTLTSEIIFVNKIIFFITISSHIQFGTAEFITDAKTSTLIQSVVSVSRFYQKIGSRISTFHVCGKFGKSRI